MKRGKNGFPLTAGGNDRGDAGGNDGDGGGNDGGERAGESQRSTILYHSPSEGEAIASAAVFSPIGRT